MNIAVNARFLLSERLEGIGRYCMETTRAMALAHPEDTFYLFFDRAYDKRFVFAENVVPVVVPLQARLPVLWHIWFEWMLPRYFKKYKIDVFYSGDTYLSMSTAVPTLLVCHDLAYRHYPEHIPARNLKYYTKHFPRFHERADRIVAVSQFTKQDVMKQYDIAEDKIDIAYNAVPDGFRPMDKQQACRVREQYTGGAPYFIYVGSLHPRKNIARLINAFDQFKSTYGSDHKLVLVGRYAWNHEGIKGAYEGASHKQDIVFTGALFDEVKDLVPAAEGLVYVSLFEGFGIPVLEGFASGVPVITSTISSMPEVAQDAAVLVDPEDILAMANAMHKITDVDVKEELVQKGLTRLKDFSWEESAAVIYQGLSEISGRANIKS